MIIRISLDIETLEPFAGYISKTKRDIISIIFFFIYFHRLMIRIDAICIRNATKHKICFTFALSK